MHRSFKTFYGSYGLLGWKLYPYINCKNFNARTLPNLSDLFEKRLKLTEWKIWQNERQEQFLHKQLSQAFYQWIEINPRNQDLSMQCEMDTIYCLPSFETNCTFFKIFDLLKKIIKSLTQTRWFGWKLFFQRPVKSLFLGIKNPFINLF